MSTVKLSKVLSELPSKDSVADNDNFVLSSYQKLPASQLATAEQLSAAKQTAADGLTTLKSALKGIANTDCARVVITESGNYAVTTNLDALNDLSAAGLYAITNARDYVYGHMLIGSDPMFHGTVQWLFGNWNVEDGKLMVSHSDGCVTIVYRVYPRSDKQWSDWKYYQQNFIKEADDSLQGGEWTYNHTAVDAIKTSLQAAIDSINTDKQKLWATLQDVDERDRDAIDKLDAAVATNTTDIATNAAAIAANAKQIKEDYVEIEANTTRSIVNQNNISNLTDNLRGHAEAITNLTSRVEGDETTIATNAANIATNKANIATNTAAIAALDAQVNDTRHHLIVKTTKDLTIAIDGKSVTIPAKEKTEIYFEKSISSFPWNNNAVCHFQLLNTKGLTNYPNLYSNKVSHVDVRDWDLSQATSLSGQFRYCSRVKDLDVSGWDVSNVTNLSNAFEGTGITTLDVSGWDTAAVTDMGNLFNGCSSLTTLDVSGWETSAVTNMERLFNGCGKLRTIKGIEHFNTSKVTSPQCMFWNCGIQGALDLRGWDASHFEGMDALFAGCSGLTALDVSTWDVSNCKSFSNRNSLYGMFRGCSQLTTLDLSNWDLSKAEYVHDMFWGCTAMQSLTLGPRFLAFKKTDYTSYMNLAHLSKWTNDTVRTSLVTNLYDRAANGLGTITLQLHANTKAVLSTEDKEYITSKGYIIA